MGFPMDGAALVKRPLKRDQALSDIIPAAHGPIIVRVSPMGNDVVIKRQTHLNVISIWAASH